MNYLANLAALSKSQVQNVHAPLPLSAHIAFCVIATAVYLIQFKRKNQNYYLYLTIAVDLTLATQLFTQDYVILALGIAEIILLAMALISNIRYKKQLKISAEKEKQREIMQKGEEASKTMTETAKQEEILDGSEALQDDSEENA